VPTITVRDLGDIVILQRQGAGLCGARRLRFCPRLFGTTGATVILDLKSVDAIDVTGTTERYYGLSLALFEPSPSGHDP
jgi:hypothetical protein